MLSLYYIPDEFIIMKNKCVAEYTQLGILSLICNT